MKKNAAIYARVSSVKQKEGETIQSQISILHEFANKIGYIVPNGWVYTDEGFSGSILQRPALDSLREISREGIVDAIIVYSPDRLARKYAYQLLLEIEFQKQGIELIFFNTPKANTPEEQLSTHFKAIFAEYERVQIIERCRRGRLYRAKQGNASVISNAPFGYDYIKKSGTSPGHYVINKDSQTVKQIFSCYIQEHISISKICSMLELEGILSPKGYKKWYSSTIRDILKNEAYIGTAHYGKSEPYEGIKGRIYHTAKGEKRTKPISATKPRPKELWIPIKVPQIISESDFEQVQIEIDKNIKTATRNTRIPSILQGLLYCGYCGRPYYKKNRLSKKTYYYCSTRLTGGDCRGASICQENLDIIIWNHIIELLKDPVLIEEEIKRRESENKDTQKITSRQKELNKELVRISKAKDKLLDAYQDGECITLEQLKERIKVLDSKQKVLLSEKDSCEQLVANNKKMVNLKNNLKRFQAQLERSNELTITEKQNVLRLLVSNIIITEEQVEVKHCIPCYETNLNQKSPLCSDGFASDSCATCAFVRINLL